MPNFDIIQQELKFKAVRSSGAGGQHVNKTASKVILNFDIPNSKGLVEEEVTLLLAKLESRLTKTGELILENSESRSQHQNKENLIKRFQVIIKEALKKPKPRKKTKPSKASKLKRLREKKILAEKKSQRQKPSL
ncbi:aminoacyl-tRNA hydrolase [Gillisia sp. M10.2A]|uniref:Aminoacyl-tRNA hydrolase n=1 Tax=Gillisia lutea TaxID=2909668 RepID=A0ABS9EC27_9FLAO|nr:alternative ribosome rescue aminoacyl-tRNA hydrolase ArfB [Gillisia lutea]MCF4100430.1 aminoacyl-tRNA hydrolase [Gillisia lutea]